MIRTFGDFQFDPATGELTSHGLPVKLESRLVRILTALLNQRGKLVTRQALYQALWDGRHVERENGLNNAVSALRRRLGEQYIETVPGHGYRFVDPTARQDALRL